jgi:hypothetical protein
VERQRLAFRSGFLPSIWMAVVSLLIGIGVGVSALLLRDGLAVNWSVTGVRLAWATPVVVGIVLLLAALYRVYVLDDGVRGYTAWGTYRTLRWPEIERVRPVNLLGLRYLRVWSDRGGPTVWVPLFLADLPGFRTAVRESAGEGHPLSRALEEATEPVDGVDHLNGKNDS